jgi:hypothetical protein
LIDPELELTVTERAHLAYLVKTDGFQIFQKICESEVEKFKVAMINVKPGNTQELVERHSIAQAAAQFYVALVSRLNNEIEIYSRAPREGDGPMPDVTEALFDE